VAITIICQQPFIQANTVGAGVTIRSSLLNHEPQINRHSQSTVIATSSDSSQ